MTRSDLNSPSAATGTAGVRTQKVL
jgi:hypothetical protein